MMSILKLNPKPGRLTPSGDEPAGAQMEAFLRGTKKHTSISTGQALFRGDAEPHDLHTGRRGGGRGARGGF